MNAALQAELRRLSAAEKLDLVVSLWDELAASEERLPIQAWHAAALAEDRARYEANPTEGAPWSAAKPRITHRP